MKASNGRVAIAVSMTPQFRDSRTSRLVTASFTELQRSDVSHGSPLACHQSTPDTDGFPDHMTLTQDGTP